MAAADLTFCHFPKLILFLSTFLVGFLVENSFQDIVGCGGFLKSSVSIDFSKVEIKLYTKQGTLKESSDCAPTNGYYFIPIYDKGEYVLKIEPPVDWSFEPKEVPLNFDGVNDPCSKAKDINFLFKGFTIQGKVNSAGTREGPENVIVTLLSDSDKSMKLTTLTKEKGHFQFSPILPGKYSLVAEHEKYKFLKNSVSIVVKEENLKLPFNSLVIAGYNIVGKVLFNGEPTAGVNFVLSANDERNRNIKLTGCSKKPLADFHLEDYLCHVTTDQDGRFRFETVPTGNFTVRPHFVKFDVQPKELNVLLGHDHLILRDNFLVKGFRVGGRVLTHAGGSGLKNAEVYLNGKRVGVTDGEGRYVLDGMEPGTYELSFRAEDVKFEVLTVKISPNSPEIESIHPSEFKVCGLVTSISGRKPETVEIERANESGKRTEASIDRETGKFCQFLKPGNYNLAVKISDSEKSSGMQYLPLVRELQVRNRPIGDVEFAQLRGNIYGRIVALPESGKPVRLNVKLKWKNSPVSMRTLEGNDLSYAFNEVAPGPYDVQVENDFWCFRKESHSVSIDSAKTLVPDFLQTGYKFKVNSSHRTSVIVTGMESPDEEFRQEISLERGENSICLPRSGAYKLTPVGCHGFERESYQIDSKDGGILNLNAVSHDVTGYIRTPYPESDMAVEVVLPTGQTTRLDLLEPEKVSDGGFVRRFVYGSKKNQLLKFVPISEKVLFRPETIEFRTGDDCTMDGIRFDGEKGLVLEGGTNPPLENVRVSLRIKRDPSGSREELTVLTKADGKYKFGPMRPTSDFELTAEKESYVFSGPDKNGIFSGHKLAEINVKVIDNATKEPLQGVLLSLTGGEKQYRKNSATEEDGFLRFHSLGPGEYFLRPMMKEYKFEPSSHIIQIREGVTESIELRGRRVSFSAYGTITSLNGEPEPNVVIEAVGTNTCSNLLEEGSSEANGQFRIRGLLPQCEYRIRLKTGPETNVRIHRLEPPDLSIKTNKGDLKGIELVAFHLVTQMDISVHVESTIPEHLKTIKLKLFKDSEPDSPVYAVKLDQLAGGAKHWGNAASQERFLKAGLLVPFPFVPRDKTSYSIQVESSLNKHAYSYRESTLHFVADKTYGNFKINFDPSLRGLDHELTQTNYVVVPLLIFALLFYAYFNKTTAAIQNFFSALNQTSFSFGREERNFYGHNNAMENVSIEPVSTKRKTKPRKA